MTHTAIQISGVETKALLLREIQASDARAFADYMLRDDFQRTIAMRHKSALEVQRFVARCVRRQALPNRTSFHLACDLKLTSSVIGDGFIVLHRPKSAELGWSVHPDMWGRGFGTEIGNALIGIAFEKLKCDTVWAKSFVENRASIRLMERNGLTFDRKEVDMNVAEGVRTDVVYHSMNADAYFDASY